jgi:hypothetical protein
MIVEVMSVADITNKPAQAKLRVVYNLDALSSIAIPNLGLQLASINTSLGPVLKQVANIAATVDAIIKPIREMIESFREMIQRIIQPVKEMMMAYATTLRFLTTFKPIYYVPTWPAAEQKEQLLDRHLSITNDQFGFFVIGGRRLRILHPSSSRGGKLLALLLRRKSQVVTYQELQEAIGSGDLKKDFKDLKYRLKKEGYTFDYELVRTEGIALIGLSSVQ